jgi:hypothetical protein
MTPRRRAARALAVVALTGAYLAAMGLEPTIHKDSARDMLLARDGLAFGAFDGCSAAFGDFRQGVLWIRFLALTFAAGLGPVGQHAILASLLVLSVCLLDRGALDHFGDAIGWAPAALFFALVLVATGYPNLWNPLFAPLGIVCLTLGLLQVVTHGSTRAACASAASLALAAEGHPAALLTAPVVVAALCMSCRRPVRALLLSIVSGVVPSFAVSSSSWLHNGQAMLREAWYVPLMAAALAGAVVGAWGVRGAWLALPVDRRRRWLLAMIVLSVLVQAAAASILSHRVLFSPQYYLAMLPALAILGGLGLWRIRASAIFGGWGRVVATAIVTVLLLVPLAVAAIWRFGISSRTASMPNYSMREAEILACSFWKAGYSFPDVQRHARGPDGFGLMASMAPFAPSPNGSVERPMEDLRILAFADGYEPDGGLPAGGRSVNLGYGRTAWILPLDGWVRLAPARVCFAALAGAGVPVCTDVATSSIAYRGRYNDLAFPALPGVHDARMQFRDAFRSATMKTTWELPIDIHGDDAERYVELVGVIGAPWVIERVEGVGHRGELPSRHVVLDRSGSTSGRMILASARAPWQDYPPDFLETRPGEAALRHSIERLPPLGHRICALLGTCP